MLFGLAAWGVGLLRGGGLTAVQAEGSTIIELPPPAREGGPGLYSVLSKRRTARALADDGISLADLGQLLWATQGLTSPHGFRTAPSAGALFPLELYVVVSRSPSLTPGTYRYEPQGHRLHRLGEPAPRPELAMAAYGQPWVAEGALLFVIAGVQSRTAVKYGERAFQYVCLEAGHAAQNLLLAAAGLDLATGLVGAFSDKRVKSLMGLPDDHTPLYLIPVGKPAAR
ncbi:MAG: hypothetical protein OZSIB_2049 [Candidatus Ozemobacter sibiricus]|uniref:Nitroreductase domain-containing protein n=1 Tax=Candidatus Ozemobacter sibiricus TaxID=2268124 RepID=A0A367ZIN8_9BACT|nr:MAG: hypothetical protein OZSIB_2049 [Candidatus Ozemobacter sibiricus]